MLDYLNHVSVLKQAKESTPQLKYLLLPFQVEESILSRPWTAQDSHVSETLQYSLKGRRFVSSDSHISISPRVARVFANLTLIYHQLPPVLLDDSGRVNSVFPTFDRLGKMQRLFQYINITHLFKLCPTVRIADTTNARVNRKPCSLHTIPALVMCPLSF